MLFDQAGDLAIDSTERELLEATAPAPARQASTRKVRPGLERFVANYRLAADSSHEMLMVLDCNRRVVYLNPKGEHLLGYQVSDIVGKPLERFALPDSAALLRVETSTGSTEPARVQLRRKNGTRLWLELSLSLLTAPHGPLGWIAHARDITEQRRAEQRLLRAHRELSAVQIVVAEATQAIDLDATLYAGLDQVLELLDVEVGAIFLLDDRREHLRVVAQRGIPRTGLSELRRTPLRVGEGLVGSVVASGQAMVLDQSEEGSGRAIAGIDRIQVFACASLFAEQHIVGAICVGRRQKEAFTSDDLRILASIGKQVGMVIENARLHEEVRRRARRLAVLYQAGRAISTKSSTSAIFATAVRAAANLTSSPVTIVFKLDADGARLHAIAAYGLPGVKWRELAWAVDQPLMMSLMRDGRIIVPDLATAEGAADIREQLQDLASLSGVVLRTYGQTIGVLVALQRLPNVYREEDIELLSCLADQAIGAVEQTRLYRATKVQAEHVAALNEITKAVAASLDPQQVLRALATQIKRLIDHDRLSIAIADEGNQVLEVSTLTSDGRPTRAQGSRVRPTETVLGHAAANNIPVVRGDLEYENSFPWDGLLLAWGMHSDITVPLSSHSRVIGALSLAAEASHKYNEHDLELLQQVAGQVSVAVENARLYQQTAADLREINALREIVEVFSAELDLDTLLHKIVASATELVQADSGSIALMDEGDGVARLRALHNLAPTLLGREIRPGDTLLGRVLVTRQPVVVHKYGESFASGGPGTEDLSSYVAVPIWWHDELIGTFAVGSRQAERRFGVHDSEMLQLLAKHAAVAIENARLYQQSRTLAVTEERNRLARDIHDTLAQSLTGIVLQLETVAGLFHSQTEEAWQELQQARALARRGLEEARQSVWALHPTPLRSMTIDQAIEKEMRAIARQIAVATHFSSKGEARPLASDVEVAIFRIAQEALSNIRKHAQAKAIEGTLEFGENAITLTVQDDGVGIVADKVGGVAHGFGLTSMRERARLLGGELRVESARGEGTRLVATIPYHVIPPTHHAADPKSALSSSPSTNIDDQIKVIIADDHAIARQGIRRMLESYGDIAVIAEAADGVEAVALSQELQPDVVLMDLQMPRLNGVEAIEQLRQANPTAKVLIISTYDKDEFLFDGIKAGARGYLLKDVPPEDLVQAVRAVNRGESLLQGVVAGKLLDRLGRLARGEDGEELTDREMGVLMLLARGARNKEIARQLTITEKTVKFHVANIFRKLGASSRTEALAIAIDRGLLQI